MDVGSFRERNEHAEIQDFFPRRLFVGLCSNPLLKVLKVPLLGKYVKSISRMIAVVANLYLLNTLKKAVETSISVNPARVSIQGKCT